jgi:hypothetical protein
MQKKHYLLALIPLAAVWAYAVSQSALTFFAVLDAVPRGRVATVSPPVVGQDEPPIAGDETDTSAAAAEAPAPIVGAPAAATQAYAPLRYAESGSDEAGDAERVEHPDITDPKMRKLLQPAWDD